MGTVRLGWVESDNEKQNMKTTTTETVAAASIPESQSHSMYHKYHT